MKGKFVILMAITALCVEQCLTSSIPMFEFLSRDEKLTHLYSMFSNQVKDYCKEKQNSNASQCKRNMMVYGMEKLNEMEESHLDKMDPYQRNANTILWDSIMENHEDMKSQRHEEDERQAYLQKEQYNQQNPIFKDRYEEVTVENFNKLGSHDQFEEDDHSNYLHEEAASQNNFAYIHKPNDLDNNQHLEQNSNYLMGGMISWMMPDGSPIRGQVPYTFPDDDMRDMTMGQKNIPSLKDLLDSMTMDEKPKIIFELPPTTTDLPKQSVTKTRTLHGNYRGAY